MSWSAVWLLFPPKEAFSLETPQKCCLLGHNASHFWRAVSKKWENPRKSRRDSLTMKLSAAALSIVFALAPEPVPTMRLLEILVDPNASAASMKTRLYVVGRGGDRGAALLRGGATGTSVSMHGAAAVVAGVGVVFLAALAGVAATRRPKTFPGPRGVIADKSDIHAHLQVIFGLMVRSGVHVEAATRSRRYNDLWRGIFDDYFGSTGHGRNFEMWDNRAAGLIKQDFCHDCSAVSRRCLYSRRCFDRFTHVAAVAGP